MTAPTPGRWKLELAVYPHQERCGPPPLNAVEPTSRLNDEIRRRWREVGRPDAEAAFRSVVLDAIDAVSWWLDPTRIGEMKASVKLTLEEKRDDED